MPAILLLIALLAQAPVVAAPGGGDPQLDHIRQAVGATPALTIPVQPDEAGRPVFRVRVQAWVFTYKPWEEPQKDVPSYIRPTMPLEHYEFLKMVTPKDFWASTLYHPMFSVTFDPVVVKNFFTEWRRAVVERNARAEVRQDFEAYLRSRAGER